MKTFINQLGFKFVVLLLMVAAISSCKKEEDVPTEPARIFKPSDVKITAGETSAKLTWTVPLMSTGKTFKYSIDFSTDSLFTTVNYTTSADTAGVTVTEENLAVRTKYYARVKANATESQPESKYIRSGAFQLTGIQLFAAVRDNEIKENNITLRYTPTVGLTSIVLTPATGTATTVTLSTTDASAGLKAIAGLTAGTKYMAELFAGTKSKGILTFTTLAPTTYTIKLNPGDDLATAITNATNGAVIGLNPGTYTLSATSFITQKTITIKSTSGNPTDTKVNYKEIDLEGTGAGVTLSGIEFDGTSLNAAYFLNFIGLPTAGAAAIFTNVIVDNCIVHAANTSFLRGSRGTIAGDQKISGITVNNSIIYDFGVNSSAAYYTFHLDNLEFKTLTVTKSTFYNSGAGLVLASKTILAAIPVVNFSNCTINGFGGSGKYALLDAATNPINFSIQNSIFANTPKSGTVLAPAVRSTGTGSSVKISNSNYFNLSSALTGGTPLTFLAATMTSNQSVNTGWTATTTDFTLAVGSPLRSAGSTGGPIGDPRWTY
jgi:hypothetical protein